MDLLLSRRLRLGISQRKLAKICKVSRRTIQQVETGRRALRANTALDLAPALQLDAPLLRELSGLPGRVLRVLRLTDEGKELRSWHFANMPRKVRELLMESHETQREILRLTDELSSQSPDEPLDAGLKNFRELSTRLVNAIRKNQNHTLAICRMLRRFCAGAEGSREDLIVQLRRTRSLSQADLAAATGVSKSTIQRIERGGEIGASAARKLGAFFEVDPSRLQSQASLARKMGRLLVAFGNGEMLAVEHLEGLPSDIRVVVDALSDAQCRHASDQLRLATAAEALGISSRGSASDYLRAFTENAEALKAAGKSMLSVMRAQIPLIGIALRFL